VKVQFLYLVSSIHPESPIGLAIAALQEANVL
jgi:hypothetical protein